MNELLILVDKEKICLQRGLAYLKEIGACLYLKIDPLTWYDAESFCESLGGRLLEIETQEIQDSFVTIRQSLGGEACFSDAPQNSS